MVGEGSFALSYPLPDQAFSRKHVLDAKKIKEHTKDRIARFLLRKAERRALRLPSKIIDEIISL
jgi:hypothetical protein